MMHPPATVAGVMAVDTDDGKLVYAVQWEDHNPLTCDGTHLELDTAGWLACPSSGCRWSFDPEARCPDHGVIA